MNTVESFLTTSPFDKTEECAKFTISDASKVFMFSNIATVGQEYTFSTWIKSAKADELVTEIVTEQVVEGFTEGTLADYEFSIAMAIPRLPDIGSICKVIWDGVEYTCPAYQFGEVVNQRYAGDPAIMGFTPDKGFAEGNGEPFCLHFITSGDQYFLSYIYTNSPASSHTIEISLIAESGAISIIIGGKEFIPTTSEWTRCEVTFKATNRNVPLRFGDIGICYLYQSKLEIGNKVTDWTPAPEDMASGEDIDNIKKSIETNENLIAELAIRAGNIEASVTSVEQSIIQSKESTTAEIETLTKKVDARMTDEEVKIEIQTQISNGTSKVTTNTGYKFDDDGLEVSKSGSEMTTKITDNGMTVYQNEDEVLVANNHGVDAKNLRATTYLIVGANSRFEDYGSDRTGCFWIGG